MAELYTIGIRKFLGNSLISRIEQHADHIHTLADLRKALTPDSEVGKGEWVDLAGLITPRSEVTKLLDELEADKVTLLEVRKRFAEMHANYYSYEWTWAAEKIEQVIGHPIDQITVEEALLFVDEWQKAVVGLINACKRVAVFANTGTSLLKLALSENSMHISAQDIDFSTSADETIACSYTGAPMSIGFKAPFLIEILSAITSDEVVLELADPARAGLILPTENEPNQDLLSYRPGLLTTANGLRPMA